MKVYLHCVHPFAQYAKGQIITDQELVKQLRKNRDHHFVKFAAPADPVEQAAETESAE